MFDIREKLTSEQSDEINGVNTIDWGDSSWKHLSLIGDEEVVSLQHTKVSVLCLGKVNENRQSKIGSSIEIARNQVHMFAKHHGTNREDELFPNTTFFDADIVNMIGQNCKCFLAAKMGGT